MDSIFYLRRLTSFVKNISIVIESNNPHLTYQYSFILFWRIKEENQT